jgi:hypothetical protein
MNTAGTFASGLFILANACQAKICAKPGASSARFSVTDGGLLRPNCFVWTFPSSPL